MNTEERQPSKPANPEPSSVAVEIDSQAASLFEDWIKQSLSELVDRHSAFATPNSNQKFFSRRSSGVR